MIIITAIFYVETRFGHEFFWFAMIFLFNDEGLNYFLFCAIATAC